MLVGIIILLLVRCLPDEQLYFVVGTESRGKSDLWLEAASLE